MSSAKERGGSASRRRQKGHKALHGLPAEPIVTRVRAGFAAMEEVVADLLDRLNKGVRNR